MRDEDFFYEGAERGDLLDALNGHAHDGATTVLEGEAGSGVSTLLGMLSMSLVGDFELIRLDGAEELGANAVVDAMLVHFDIERADLADTLKQTLADTSLVIVVDNAHLAPSEALATMASLKTKLGQRLTYVFGGEPGSAEHLR
ncbi:MAG: cell division protein, partial [Alloalcanivorax venustensis]